MDNDKNVLAVVDENKFTKYLNHLAKEKNISLDEVENIITTESLLLNNF